MKPVQVFVDEDKWEDFRIWCANHKTTIKNEIDAFLSRFSGGNARPEGAWHKLSGGKNARPDVV